MGHREELIERSISFLREVKDMTPGAGMEKWLNEKYGEDSDLYRIARVYQQAGQWEKAEPLFTQYFARNPREAKDLAEVGTYYFQRGDRAKAEELFARSFAADGDDVWATLLVAGAYLGVKPPV